MDVDDYTTRFNSTITTSNNLNADEIKALSELNNNKEIIITKADKSGTTVILNKIDYIREAESKLQNPLNFSPSGGDNKDETISLIEPQLDRLLSSGYINKAQLNFFNSSLHTGKTRIQYNLPKIHKNPNSWFSVKIPPSRPIVSDVGSCTYEIAKYISDNLKEVACKHASYIRDSYDFISKLNKISVPPDAALVTIDVQNLYPSIPNHEGLAAVRYFFNKYPDPKRPDEIILNLLEICLTKNCFMFNDKFYTQIDGAAMGHSYCVHYANLFMAHWEQKALNTSILKPLSWDRFIDDIFSIWLHGYAAFIKFMEHLNNISASIKLTFEYEQHAINFLDITIYKGDRFRNSSVLDTKVYFKPTNKHQLLHKDSHHPKHIFKSIVKSQLIRFSRICNNMEDFETATTTLFTALYKRGYSKRFLRYIKEDVKNKRQNLSPNNSDIGSGPCNSDKCERCPFITSGTSISINSTPFGIKSKLTCNSHNVIYVISCQLCQLHYIGQTSQLLRTRLGQHLNAIKSNKETYIAQHFNEHSNPLSETLRITPILYVSDHKYRGYLEMKLIKKFDTLYPHGLNDRFDSNNSDGSLIPIVVPFSEKSHEFAKNLKSLAIQHNVTQHRIITAFTRSKNLGELVKNRNPTSII